MTDPYGEHVHDENCHPAFLMIERQTAMQTATREVMGHDLRRMLDEIPEEHLRTLIMVIDSITMSDKPERLGAYLVGRAASAMETRFKVCSACGSKHDDASELDVPLPVKARRKSEASDWTPIGSKNPIGLNESGTMLLYGLDDLRNEETGELVGFICTNCQQRYPTIQDRMLQPPGVEGCSGCQQKAKFG
jgi:hypothetical protein